jgi:excisionase family DNA binding protein
VAARLGVSAATVRRWLSSGQLEGIRVGGRLRVAERALETIVRSACADNEETP